MPRTARALMLMAAVSACGCRAIGNLPGIDPTDYAYLHYQGYTTQVYQETVPQVKSSALQALADLGFTDIHVEPGSGCILIHALTLDGRKSEVAIRPRNHMASMTVHIHPIGDEMVEQAVIQRVALNFGELPRTIVPLEPTLRRRTDPLSPAPVVATPAGPSAITLEPAPPPGPGPFATVPVDDDD